MDNLPLPIQTTRQLLCEFAASDFAEMFAFESDPEVVKFVCYGPYTTNQCRRDLAFRIAQQTARPRMYYHLAIILQGKGKLIGWCGLEIMSQDNREYELGYALNQLYWGEGYATEAANAMM